MNNRELNQFLLIMLGYARDENDVARDLYAGLVQFFTLFEAYRGRPFFATGESYAGIYLRKKNVLTNLKNLF